MEVLARSRGARRDRRVKVGPSPFEKVTSLGDIPEPLAHDLVLFLM